MISIARLQKILLISSMTLMTIIYKIQIGSIRNLLLVIFIGVLWYFIYWNRRSLLFHLKRIISSRQKLISFTSILFILMIFISIFRAHLFGIISIQLAANMICTWLTITLLIISIVPRDIEIDSGFHAVKYLLFAVNFYIAINVILYFMGISGAGDIYNDRFGKAVVLGYFGLDMERILFPLAPGITSFGVISGLSFIISYYLFKNNIYSNKIISYLAILTSLFVLLTTDSRGAILSVIITLIIINFYKLSLRNNGKLISLPIFILVIIFSYYLLINMSNLSAIQSLSRGEDIGSGRTIIWLYAVNFIKDFNLSHLFGFGYMGHAASGLSEQYKYLFYGWNTAAPETVSLHNAILQIFIDYGYIGTILFFIIIYYSLSYSHRLYKREKYLPIIIFISIIIYLTVTGIFSLSYNIYFFHCFIPFLAILVLFSLTPIKVNTQNLN